MLGIYNYTVVLTYVGMLSGFAGISFAMQSNYHTALICLIVSGVCDMFDGKIASTMDRTSVQKRFGIQIDSLSDLICFGVLPAVITVSICANSTLSFCLSSMYVLSALIRLSWFNVEEEIRQDSEDGRREFYLGLPVTTAAIFVPLSVWIAEYFGWTGQISLPLLLAAMSAAFLTPFHIRKPSFSAIWIALCGGVGVLMLLFSGMDM